MKNNSVFLLVIISLFGFSCKNTRYITEAYIKNNVQEHPVDTKTSIKTYSIYQGMSKNDKNASTYIEFTGCKYNDTKKLVIGADNNYHAGGLLSRNIQAVVVIDYLVLNMSQTLAILSNYNELREMMRSESPIKDEEIYHDYSVSDDFYISFRKAIGRPGIKTIDVWVKGNKYPIKTKKFIKKLKKFINY
jgi:hypothetical protein